MIPNDIIPSNPMRGAVNKTSETPDDIPHDVWEVANGIAHRTPTAMNVTHPLAVVIAHEIMGAKLKEREACALVAEKHAGVNMADNARFVSANIAAAIRKRGGGQE